MPQERFYPRPSDDPALPQLHTNKKNESVILKAALAWCNLEKTTYGGGDIIVVKLQTEPVVVAEALTSSIRR